MNPVTAEAGVDAVRGRADRRGRGPSGPLTEGEQERTSTASLPSAPSGDENSPDGRLSAHPVGPDDARADARRRLRRAEGQVGAVVRLLDEGADCRAVLTQLSAATRALQQAGFRLLASNMTECLTCPDDVRDGPNLDELERLFLKL